MMHNWDLLGDRPYSPERPSRRESTQAAVLSWLSLPSATDAELVALMAVMAARYSGRQTLDLGWSDGGPWRAVRLDVDVDRPFDAVVAAAADALRAAPTADIPAIGIGRAGAPAEGCPALLWVGTDGSISCATELYDPADAIRFAGQLATLGAARSDPGPVAGLPLLAPAELAALQLPNAAAASVILVPDSDTLTDLVAVQVRDRPDEPAVRAAGQQLTYRQLWDRSGAVAVTLEPQSLVGVWADRSVDMMVALVAVLRAGAAYVALEPSYPAARLGALADAAGIDTVLGNADIDQLGRPGVRVVPIGGPFPANSTARLAGPHADDLAYVMFTSGSTGKPKGVMVEHRNVVNLLRHLAVEPGLASGEVMLGVTTAAFDLSVPDLFLPLVTGATLELIGSDDARDGKRLAAAIASARPDLMQATPSTWRMLIEAGWPGAPQLRVVCGGEGYDAALTHAIDARVAGVWNFYGPTETCVWSVSTQLGAAVRDPIPIGLPMRGTACYVVDDHDELVPPGVRGELCIAGAGVARGYLAQPELTTSVFVPCDFPGAPSARMYRTGDLARVSPSGQLTFAGRRDFQVKLNGFRIELGEVEAVVSSLAGVTQAVAVVRSTERGPRLLCYVTGGDLDAHELRVSAAALLPPQSVPSVIVVLEVLPLNSNGKVDRDALVPPSDRTGRELAGPFEQLVATVWTEVLGAPRVYGDDDIFELGADSLDIGRIAIRLTARLAVDVTPGEIFRHPTVGELAGALLELVVAVDDDLLAAAEADGR